MKDGSVYLNTFLTLARIGVSGRETSPPGRFTPAGVRDRAPTRQEADKAPEPVRNL